MSSTVKVPRAFRAWASCVYGWRKGDFARLVRDKPDVLSGIIAYWRSNGSPNGADRAPKGER